MACWKRRNSRPKAMAMAREAMPRRSLYLKSLAFDPIKPGVNPGICCEWWVEETIPDIRSAHVYVEGLEQPVGMAQVIVREGGMLVQLKQAVLPVDAETVSSPERIRLVLEPS